MQCDQTSGAFTANSSWGGCRRAATISAKISVQEPGQDKTQFEKLLATYRGEGRRV